MGTVSRCEQKTYFTDNEKTKRNKRKQIKEMENKLTDYLLNRFDDAKVAYDTVAKMIVNVTREEIVEYLENASK